MKKNTTTNYYFKSGKVKSEKQLQQEYNVLYFGFYSDFSEFVADMVEQNIIIKIGA